MPLVIGRTEEMRQVIQGILRADKNGVVLIGEAGVGKTCVVEGLAQFFVTGRLPNNLQEKLKGKRIIKHIYISGRLLNLVVKN